MTTDHDPQPTTPPPANNDSSPRLSPALSRVVVTVLAVLLVMGVVAAGVLVYQRGDQEAALEERADAARAAEQFVVRLNTFDSRNLDGYLDSVNDMLTTAEQASRARELEGITTLIEETELRSTGELLASGVAHVDQDDARVLVVADAEANSIAGQRTRHFRWEIDLAKVEGDWLVDEWSPVQGEQSLQ